MVELRPYKLTALYSIYEDESLEEALRRDDEIDAIADCFDGVVTGTGCSSCVRDIEIAFLSKSDRDMAGDELRRSGFVTQVSPPKVDEIGIPLWGAM